MSVTRVTEPGPGNASNLIAQLIAEQQSPTAIEEFALRHERGEFEHARLHRTLLPVSAPAPGQQYAFEVQLDRCSGCKACVTACHSLNGLDDNETWREVGLLIEPPKRRRYAPTGREVGGGLQQHITTACHHCIDPACLNGCPVLAYDKDPLTGIVRHLDDQCIGCQYCVLKCPYDVPKYNARLGIVRKCDMCSSRLAANEAPACAQACPTEAIRIVTINSASVRLQLETQGTSFLPGAPSGGYTLPTTRYVDGNASPADNIGERAKLVAADSFALVPQPAHWPLVIMLVLTQASVGAAIAALAMPATEAGHSWLWRIAGVFTLLGLGASVFHLGRPLGAWRSFLNLKRSWMSREIVAFALYAALLAVTGLPGVATRFTFLPASTMVAGILAVACSAMIYADTRRELWRARRTVPLFLLSTLLLGAAAALFFASEQLVAALVVAITTCKLALELEVVRHVTAPSLTSMKKTALLVTGPFQLVAWLRIACVLVGGVGLPVLVSAGAFVVPQAMAAAAFLLLTAGELCERWLFFRAVVALKMPGGLSS